MENWLHLKFNVESRFKSPKLDTGWKKDGLQLHTFIIIQTKYNEPRAKIQVQLKLLITPETKPIQFYIYLYI